MQAKSVLLRKIRLISPCLKAGALRRFSVTKPVPVVDDVNHSGLASYSKSELKKILGSEMRPRPNESTRLEGFVIVHGGLMIDIDSPLEK
jgi:hypothetical protein